MLISKVSNGDRDKGERIERRVVADDSHHYQTASQLYQIMAKNENYNTGDGDTLTTRDLVLLYKNIEQGTSTAAIKEIQCTRRSNQHVETIVYNDSESDNSDVTEGCSNDDLRNVILINKERIDLLTNQTSIESTLCHKLGDLEIRTSFNDYDKHFSFKDSYLKDQLKRINFLSTNTGSENSVLPGSLLDYISCKRLEDNYNFYMDSVIKYVKNTIEQLRRISNGDYLTDRVKEKWREVEQPEHSTHNSTKILATSTSIPLHVERKSSGQRSMWDDIVHSEVDVRSLSKILEKKIVVEIPRFIKGSYTLLSRCYEDNLIISCKKDQLVEDSKDSRVDVVLQLKRSDKGHVISKISSIMVLQTAPITHCIQDTRPSDAPLALMYKEMNENSRNVSKNVIITELEEKHGVEENSDVDVDSDSQYEDVDSDNFDNLSLKACDNHDGSMSEMTATSSVSSNRCRMAMPYPQKEAKFEMCPEDLRMTIQRLTIPAALLEENAEDVSQVLTKKSSTRIRIKSPYENKSLAIEEKKRRKLLEIREKRERKKMAMAENCKITKHKYAKGGIMPNASSSVTKLSITNKSFYNSIYGQTKSGSNVSKRIRKGMMKGNSLDIENLESDEGTIELSQDRDSNRLHEKSYSLEDTVTEMMHQQENDKEILSPCTSIASNTIQNILSHLIVAPDSNMMDSGDHGVSTDQNTGTAKKSQRPLNEQSDNNKLVVSERPPNVVPTNTPKAKIEQEKNISPTVECRKSIDKIYQLMNQLGKPNSLDAKSQHKSQANCSSKTDGTGKETSSVQGSDSGTSFKHHLTSSNPSTFSFDKSNTDEQKSERVVNVIPKVIISSKSCIPSASSNSSPKVEADYRKDLKKPTTSKTLQNNPLKAISQLLLEFEHVQKNRLKSEPKLGKKPDISTISNDGKSNSRQSYYTRRSRLERHNDALEKYKVTTPREVKIKSVPVMDVPKIPYQQVPTDDRYGDKNRKKKIVDIIDEAKEARGEAVRGPSKFTSRLNSLAQPKKSYVQAHSEEYQTRYGRNLITDRLQRLAATSSPSPPVTERPQRPVPPRSKMNDKTKRRTREAVSPASLKLPYNSGLPIAQASRIRHSSSSSPPEPKHRREVTDNGSSYKQSNVPETSQTFKKKMVTVESYVKNHFGRTAVSAIPPYTLAKTSLKSRTSTVPDFYDLASGSTSSLQESSQIGSKLRRMIDSMYKNNSTELSILPECHETISKCSKEVEISLAEDLTMGDEGSLVESEHSLIAEDFGLAGDVHGKDEHQKTNDTANNNQHNVQSLTPGQETINYVSPCPLPVGTFSNRLIMRTSDLNPQPSMRPLFVYQQHDTRSLVSKTSISQNLQAENLIDLKSVPLLSNSLWNLNLTHIPVQIATVGYSFPEYEISKLHRASKSPSLGKLLHKDSNKSLVTLEKGTSAPFHDMCKGVQLQPLTEQGVQVNSTSMLAKEQTNRHNTIPKRDVCTADGEINAQPKKVVQSDVKEDTKVIHSTSSRILKEANHDEIDNTTSLDILVGLLNEIQKITTCQTHINDSESEEGKELEMILNNTAMLEHSFDSNPDSVSVTSLENLRCLDSNTSICSFYVSDGSKKKRNLKNDSKPETDYNYWFEPNRSKFKPTFVDKGVSVDISNKEYVNKVTDIPSVFLPVVISHSTNVTNSLLGDVALFQPSTQSQFSLTDYHSLSNSPSLTSSCCKSYTKRVIELPQALDITDLSVERFDGSQKNKIKTEKQEKRRVYDQLKFKKKLQKPTEQYVVTTESFDPVMKMKRDILVTIYSMLVLTVFAALSFPEVMHHLYDVQ